MKNEEWRENTEGEGLTKRESGGGNQRERIRQKESGRKNQESRIKNQE
jgi:hypothetical protein